MKALTVRQPYATLLAIGAKRVETRSWAPHGLAAGEWVAIHAAKEWYTGGRELARGEPCASALRRAARAGLLLTTDPSELLRSRILALVRFAGAIPADGPEADALPADERAIGIYGPGRWGWVFDAVRPLGRADPGARRARAVAVGAARRAGIAVVAGAVKAYSAPLAVHNGSHADGRGLSGRGV